MLGGWKKGLQTTANNNSTEKRATNKTPTTT